MDRSHKRQIRCSNKEFPVTSVKSNIAPSKISDYVIKTGNRLACKQALRGDLAGGAGKGRRACNYVSEIQIPPPAKLWLPVVWGVRFWPISANQKPDSRETRFKTRERRSDFTRYANLMRFWTETNFGLCLLFLTNSFTIVIDFQYEPLLLFQF